MNDSDPEHEAIHARYAIARKLAYAEARRQLAEEWERRGVAQPKPRMPRISTRKARLIRAGILAARDPELAQYAHLGHRIVREAARREAAKMAAARLHPNARCATPSQWDGWSMPQRAIVGIDPKEHA